MAMNDQEQAMVAEEGPSAVKISPMKSTESIPTPAEIQTLLRSWDMLDINQYLLLSAPPKEYTELLDNGVVKFSSASGRNGRLSNMYAAQMEFSQTACRVFPANPRVRYRTVEHLYQSERYRLASLNGHSDDDGAEHFGHVAEWVRRQMTAREAKDVAHCKEDEEFITKEFQELWDQKLRIGVMRWALWKKFGVRGTFVKCHLGIGAKNREVLEKTGNAYIREVCKTHVDRFWGVSEGVGQNMLGRLLMEMRERLRNS